MKDGSSLTHWSILEKLAQEIPQDIALLGESRLTFSYAHVQAQIEYTVSFLNEWGLGRNDTIVVVLENGPEMAMAFLSLTAGIKVAPLNPNYQERELRYYFSQTQAKAVLLDPQKHLKAKKIAQEMGIGVLSLVKNAPESQSFTWQEIHPPQKKNDSSLQKGFSQSSDIALILHTSGTTSQPKMVPLKQSQLCLSASNIQKTLELTSSDRCFNIMPLFHIHGLVAGLLSSVLKGASVVCTRGFDPNTFMNNIEKYQASWYTAVPTMHQNILQLKKQEPKRKHSLRFIRSSSAPLPETVIAGLEEFFAVPVIEAYGMTEAAHQISSNPLPPDQRKSGSVGKASGPKVAIMGEKQDFLAPKQIGEIVIQGNNVITGYAHNKKANQENFVGGWFCTGDQGYLDSEGYLYICGRLKEMINRGGEKIFPKEVDEVLLAHQDVAQALTFASAHSSLGEDVAAAIVLKEGKSLSKKELQKFVGEHLARFKVPQEIFFLEKIPTGPTGKPDRIGMPRHLGLGQKKEREKEEEGTPLEEKIKEIYKEVLSAKSLSLRDSFFQQGGDSLSAIRVISRLRHQLKKEISLKNFFLHSSIKDLAILLKDIPEHSNIPLLLEKTSSDPVLSLAQERVYLLSKLEKNPAAYHRALVLDIEGPLDPEIFAQSIQKQVAQEEIFHTFFPSNKEGPFPQICPNFQLPYHKIDLSELSSSEQESTWQATYFNHLNNGFLISERPPLEIFIHKLAPEKYRLFCSFHHLVFDGFSAKLFQEKLVSIYQAQEKNESLPQSSFSVKYSHYAHWQRSLLQKNLWDKEWLYWENQLKDLPLPASLPFDKHVPKNQDEGTGNRIYWSYSLETSQKITGFSLEKNATLFMTLLASLQALLYRYKPDRDVVIGTFVNTRNRIELESQIGLYLNTLVLRANLSPSMTYDQLVEKNKRLVLEALQHQNFPFEEIVKKINPQRHLGTNPFFETSFQMRSRESHQTSSGVTFREKLSPLVWTPFALSIEAWLEGNQLIGFLEYKTSFFEKNTIEIFLKQWQELLSFCVENPDKKISQVPFFSAIEKDITSLTPCPYYCEESSLDQIFSEQAQKYPTATALVWKEKKLSYRQLDQESGQLANYLKKRGCQREDVIALFLPRSFDLIVSILAIVKLGATYLPLNVKEAPNRLAHIMEDSQASLVISKETFYKEISFHSSILLLDVDKEWTRESSSLLKSFNCPQSIAYIIYTSGSTGTPKGVAVAHEGVQNLCLSSPFLEYFGPDKIAWQLAFPSFDASTVEIWGPLLQGGQCVLFPEEVPSGAIIASLAEKYPPDFLFLTTSLFNAMVEEDIECFQKITEVWTGGEEASLPVIQKFIQRYPQKKIINGYGPTENTVFTTWHPITKENPLLRKRVSIGKTVSRSQIFILDSKCQLVPPGIAGEIYIGGPGLASGYWRKPELSAQSFVPHPFSLKEGERLYKTGDKARYLSNGEVEFLGRTDEQVKLRGFRIELNEIEIQLEKHPQISQAIALILSKTHEKQLFAFYTGASPLKEIQQYLSSSIPSYMIPPQIVFIEHFPLNYSGKVNRRALEKKALSFLENANKKNIVSPRSPLEKELWSIWQELFHGKEFGIEDNFFDLGGHSLLANRLAMRIQHKFYISFTLRDLFEAPSIAQSVPLIITKQGSSIQENELSHLLSQVQELSAEETRKLLEEIVAPQESLSSEEEKPTCSYPISLFKKGKSGKKFFFCHGDFMGGGYYWHQAHHAIKDSFDLYTIEPHGSQNEEIPLSIEEMALDCIEKILLLQTEGTYFLGGFCHGGQVAFEIAKLLLKRGKKVGAVLLIDAKASNQNFQLLRKSTQLWAKVRKLSIAQEQVFFLQMRELLILLKNPLHYSKSLVRAWKFFFYSGQKEKTFFQVLKNENFSEEERERFLSLSYRRIANAYIPSSQVCFPIFLLWPKDKAQEFEKEVLSWKKLSPQVQGEMIEGNHLTCLSQKDFPEKLQQYFEKLASL